MIDGCSLLRRQFMTPSLFEMPVSSPTVARDSSLNMIAFIEVWRHDHGSSTGESTVTVAPRPTCRRALARRCFPSSMMRLLGP